MPSKIVDSAVFSKLIFERSLVLVSTADRMVSSGAESFQITRPLLGVLLQESTQLEELLDAYGARINQQWHTFRLHVATIKNFSSAGYELLHLRSTLQNYDFQGEHPHFREATEDAIDFVASYIFCALHGLLEDTKAFDWGPPEALHGYDFSENLPAGRLPKNRKVTGNTTAQQLVTSLATNFLNNTEDAKFLDTADKCRAPDWKGLNFDLLTETTFLILEGKFHTMQSLYDTYISFSDIEGNDTSLRGLRGHISVVLHLLKIATIFIHFYERHLKIQRQELFCHDHCVLGGNWYMEVLTHYLCHYAYEFLVSARGLCQLMLQKYAIIETREVPAPLYFGFHVRPSTLVAAIVRHYGGKVTLILDREYDASAPMNLFLVNEWVNQLKRQHVGEELHKMDSLLLEMQTQLDHNQLTKVSAVRNVIRALAQRNVINVLKYPLNVEPIINSSSAPNLLELMQSVVATLLAQREINILYPIKVKFRGDARVLQDIELLAANGYGENETGSNIPLPPELTYLTYSRV
ncbi:MAG: hypothetical protein IKS83_00695 [Victivallales bacterium]|nr:hypothetical protein [Victivallales bacterium]